MLTILCLILVVSSAYFIVLMLSLNKKMEELSEELSKLAEGSKKIQKGLIELEKKFKKK